MRNSTTLIWSSIYCTFPVTRTRKRKLSWHSERHAVRWVKISVVSIPSLVELWDGTAPSEEQTLLKILSTTVTSQGGVRCDRIRIDALPTRNVQHVDCFDEAQVHSHQVTRDDEDRRCRPEQNTSSRSISNNNTLIGYGQGRCKPSTRETMEHSTLSYLQ